MNDNERLQADYAGMGLTIGPHPMALRRERSGAARRAAGLGSAAGARRPARARGRHGDHAPASRHRQGVRLPHARGRDRHLERDRPARSVRSRAAVVIRQPFLIVEGVLQHQDGVLSVRAERVEGIEGGRRSTRTISTEPVAGRSPARFPSPRPLPGPWPRSPIPVRRPDIMSHVPPHRHRPGRHEDRRDRARREREVARLRVATPRDDYDGHARRHRRARRRTRAPAGAKGTVGVGIPRGTLARHGARQERQLHLADRKAAAVDLEARLERPVRIANDANCFAVSEAATARPPAADVVFGVIVGTGTGAGVVVHGRRADGTERRGRRMGPQSAALARPGGMAGPACYCGKTGCIETFLSGPGSRATTGARRPMLKAARESSLRAAAGDAHAEAALVRYEDRLARALAAVINVLESGRDRPRRRDVEHRPSLSERAAALGCATYLVHNAAHRGPAGMTITPDQPDCAGQRSRPRIQR